jgi:hypothetical protein
MGSSPYTNDRNQALSDAYKNALLNVIEREFPNLISISTRSSEKLEGGTYQRETAYKSESVQFNGLLEDNDSPFIEFNQANKSFMAFRLLCWSNSDLKTEKKRQADQIKNGYSSISNKIDGLLPINAKPGPTGELEITTIPAGAAILLAATPVGNSNARFERVIAGTYDVVVQKDGYEIETRRITVDAGKTATERFELQKIKSSIHITSDPPGALVYINNKPQDKLTPLTIERVVGEEIDVRLEKDDFYPERRDLSPSNLPRTEEFVLRAQDAFLGVLSTPIGAQVLLNGKKIGSTPLVGYKVKGGMHEVKLQLSGYANWVESFEAWRSSPKVISAKLSPSQSKVVEQSRQNGQLTQAIRDRRKGMGKFENEQYEDAFELFNKSCAGGDATGCAFLGVLYENGQGTRKNIVKARRYYKDACSQGAAEGCNGLGLTYSDIDDHDLVDFVLAGEYLEKACKIGFPAGCINLGYMFANEDNPNQDRYKAREYFALACGRGSMTGCYELGRMYLSGVGGPKDRSKARNLFLKACESGEEKACKYTD